MPLKNGVCIPSVCVSVEFDKTTMLVTFVDTKKNKVVPQPALWNAATVAAEIAARTPEAGTGCDGCICWKPWPATPWTPLPTIRVTHPVVVNYKVVMDIAGLSVRARWGLCLPAG